MMITMMMMNFASLNRFKSEGFAQGLSLPRECAISVSSSQVHGDSIIGIPVLSEWARVWMLAIKDWFMGMMSSLIVT